MVHVSFFFPLFVDKEFIFRERTGTVILRNVETNISTVLIEGKKIVSTPPNDQDNFSFFLLQVNKAENDFRTPLLV
jgi:hypothetical protein